MPSLLVHHRGSCCVFIWRRLRKFANELFSKLSCHAAKHRAVPKQDATSFCLLWGRIRWLFNTQRTHIDRNLKSLSLVTWPADDGQSTSRVTSSPKIKRQHHENKQDRRVSSRSGNPQNQTSHSGLKPQSLCSVLKAFVHYAAVCLDRLLTNAAHWRGIDRNDSPRWRFDEHKAKLDYDWSAGVSDKQHLAGCPTWSFSVCF